MQNSKLIEALSVELKLSVRKAANVKKDLFIAKLHLCICSYEYLKALENVLFEKCGLKTSMQQTSIM